MCSGKENWMIHKNWQKEQKNIIKGAKDILDTFSGTISDSSKCLFKCILEKREAEQETSSVKKKEANRIVGKGNKSWICSCGFLHFKNVCHLSQRSDNNQKALVRKE